MSQFKLGSKIAFGATRCVLGVKQNEDALVSALQKGVKVVDTSAAYMGGFSEKMVGTVLDRRRESGEDDGKDLTIISKFGYASADKKHPGFVKVAPSMSHSLHPDFFRHELKSSSERLNGNKINVYMIEHPEATLAAKLGVTGKLGGGGADGRGEFGAKLAQPSKARMDDARGALYEEVTALFEAMEERTREEAGFMYGVSSMGLSMPKDEHLHISWERLVGCAEAAASRIGNERHSFRVVEMPGNLLEITGLSTAPAIAKAGINVNAYGLLGINDANYVASIACYPCGRRRAQVMIGDPLRATIAEGRYNLSDDALRVGIPLDYMDVCREVLEHFTPDEPSGPEPTQEEIDIKEGCDFLQQLIKDMNGQLTKFTSLEHYEAELAAHITPLIDSHFEGFDDTSSAMLVNFFDRFGKMVRYSCAEKTREMITSGAGCASGAHTLADDEPLQTYAIRWLTEYPGVACTIVDMDTLQLVDDGVAALKKS